ncbi:MAG: ATP-dependent protease, partial [Eubacteriales bacterium]|nr:ATP-dependent protease [Eubacteriales bacterium]
SSLADLPIFQGIAVTGSVNQLGDVQPIGGVTEKVEGFYDICAAGGLSGEQGVIVPVQNVDQLMLRDDIVTAVEKNQFHLYAIRRIEEGIEILTGHPAGASDENGNFPDGSVYGLVMAKLERFCDQSRPASPMVK